ncbi:hypothetical protein ABZ953_28135 [Streptomyces sp. NPDC046465]|uniref:hypothetical protein n=1 Tax=Streptomyces sp. NPDC046465 TaxID=3155810 RepID=UPI0033E22817
MLHETEDIERERLRVARRPAAHNAPPVLSWFDVTPTVPGDAYEGRLRSVLDAALGLALSADFTEEDLPVAAVPEWFTDVSGRPLSADAPEFARRGRERYAAAIRGGSWELQGWLHEFDPDSESRGWAWWDLTHSADGTVRIWADTWGESFFACDELRWLAYVAGGESVSGPYLARVDAWHAAVAVREDGEDVRGAELAHSLAESGLRYLGLADPTAPLLPPCLAFFADAVETGGEEWAVSVESDDPDLRESVNHQWYMLGADQGLFQRDAPEFLLAVGDGESATAPSDSLRWARVALTVDSDIAGHLDFAMLSLDGNVVVRGVAGEKWTDCVLLKAPHRFPALRELGTRMAASPETRQGTREALQRWLEHTSLD